MATNYRQMFEKALLDSHNGGNEEMKQLEQQIMQKGTGANLAPTMGLVDHLTGSKLAGLVPQEETVKDKLSRVLQMRQQMESKKLDGLGKLAQMQDAAEGRAAEMAFKEKMFNLKKAGMLQKAMAKPKIGSEDKKSLGFIQSLMRDIPSYQEALKSGDFKGGLRPGIWSDFAGDTPTMAIRKALVENYGRLQSGGAISGDEEKRFGHLFGSVTDSPEIVQQKIGRMIKELSDKNNLYGGGDFISMAQSPGLGSSSSSSSSSGTNYDDLSDEELEMVFAQRGLK